MSKYTEEQALRKAKQIFERFGSRIHLACPNSIVPEDFLGGFIGVEAGIDHNGLIKESATRFEPGVYHHLLAVRDGLLSSYNKIHRGDIAGLSDDAIHNLATSWGVTQIMGWHLIHNLKGKIADLRDPEKHLFYAVELLVLTAGPHLKTRNFGNVLRIWNSGSANGKTFDPHYVENALAVKAEYAKLRETGQWATLVAGSTAPADEVSPDASRFEDSAVEQPADIPPQQIPSSEPTGNANTSASDPAPSLAPPSIDPAAGGATQNAESIVNVAGDKTVPDNFVPEDKTVDAPGKEGSTAKATAITIAGFTVPAFLVGFIHAAQSAIDKGFISAADIGNAVLSFIQNNTKFVFAGLGLVVGGMMLKKLYKQITLWLSMYIAARADMHNVTVKPQ